ncbi:DUF4166 domain-containing protein [Dyella mobilis]|uniref:DUF4166 domain-containing protein n=1 Tax=Dyella mobilis TaxID=1849582 RepID=UPI00235CBE92|nr:DUF4166 domain-containing protein [Dyella mobilis]GLQ98583.1 hypothetical protein GCM10007863_30030 [Dyella mobilis]
MDEANALFPGLLGDTAWQALPEPVRRMHGNAPRVAARGMADVEGGTHLVVRVLRTLLGLPSPGTQQALAFSIERSNGRETWTRGFARSQMRSVLVRDAEAPHLLERLGPITLRLALQHDATGIDWHLLAASAWGMPIPRTWLGKVVSRCSARDGRYTFDIDTRLPLAGRLVTYRGWLEIVPDD